MQLGGDVRRSANIRPFPYSAIQIEGARGRGQTYWNQPHRLVSLHSRGSNPSNLPLVFVVLAEQAPSQ